MDNKYTLFYLVRNGIPYNCFFMRKTAYFYAHIDGSRVVAVEF